MASQPIVDRAEVIAVLNDHARLGLDRTAKITVTRNCLAAFCDLDFIGISVVQAQLLAAFRNCSFTSESPERDFAEIVFRDRRVCRVGAARRRAAPP